MFSVVMRACLTVLSVVYSNTGMQLYTSMDYLMGVCWSLSQQTVAKKHRVDLTSLQSIKGTHSPIGVPKYEQCGIYILGPQNL